MINNVQINCNNGLCCSCGICKSVCPFDAISYDYVDGMYVPEINNNCKNCNICVEICPGLSQDYSKDGKKQELRNAAIGNFISCFNAWSLNERIRHISASGGIVTTLINKLLSDNKHDIAFCTNSYNYHEQVKTFPYSETLELDENFGKTPKSRYVPVSHENAIDYILNNRDKKVIITAVPCALKGIVKVIKRFNLNRDNYLLIGLFCQKQFQYQIFDYYKSFSNTRNLCELHFKNKESGGWPGNSKLIYENKEYEYKTATYRTTAKDYFQPERCLYCIDKLAVDADISLGDNYTGINESELGSNSVIIRTKNGEHAWDYIADTIEKREITIDDIIRSEALDDRLINYHLGLQKERKLAENNELYSSINEGIVCDDENNCYQYFVESLRKIEIGKNYNNDPNAYENELINQKRINVKKAKIHKIKVVLSKIKRLIVKSKD